LIALPPAAGSTWIAEQGGERARVQGLVRADVAIVGAGLTGLSTAFHLKRSAPGAQVVVVDAGAVASGASGRGTGLLGPRVGPGIATARKRYGARAAAAMYAESVAAVEEVLRLVEEQTIECGAQRGPQFVVARTRGGAAALAAQAAVYAALGCDVPYVSGADLVGIPAGLYRAALRYAPSATLDPASLTRGLARRAEAAGAVIYERSPVLGIERKRVLELRLPDALIRATNVVLATNAFPAPAPGPRSMLPLEAQAIATEPLAPEIVAELGWNGGYAVLESGGIAPYYRLTADLRVVLGGGVPQLPDGASADASRQSTWRQQERWLRALHPALSGVRVSHRWSGYIAITRDWLPVVGPSERVPGLWFAGGWCGHGLAFSIRSGRELAQALLAAAIPRVNMPWWRGDGPFFPGGTLARALVGGSLCALRELTACEGALRARFEGSPRDAA
jgi:glycine/D-amino acid oxidase-like deaminating enzyme